MDEFINSLDIARFESTNGLWNELMLNDPWSVGYVTTLIETQEFKNKEAWESFYYSSGEQRQAELAKLPSDLVGILNNEQLVRTNKGEILQMGWSLKNLNFSYGRTILQMETKGTILYESAIKRGIAISRAECIEAVRFRTICQTWNGVVIREKRTIALLQQKFPGLGFHKTDGNFDYEFAVDYQVFKQDALICGIQIKPNSYNRSTAPYVRLAKAANKRKNRNYSDQFGVPVFDIFYERGQILNENVMDDLTKLLR